MLKASQLPEIEIFDELIQKPKNAFVEQAISDGRIPVGYACYIMPEPLLMVGNLFPVRMRAPQVDHSDKANYWMSNLCCSYSRSVLEAMLDGDYDFLRGMVSGAACTHINRTVQHTTVVPQYKSRVDAGEFLFYSLDSPRATTEPGKRHLVKDLKRAAVEMERVLGVKCTDDALRKAIHELNEFRALLRKVSEFRKGPDTRITGTEFHKVMVASLVAPKDMLIEPMKKLIAALEKREPVSGFRARLMLVGSTFDNPAFTELIENEDALVVCDRYCFGSFPGMEPIPEDGDPWETLAAHYVDTCQCSRMMGQFEKRYNQKADYIKEFSVDGVVIQTIKFCDLWAYEVPMALDQYKLDQIPAMKIEHEYRMNGEGQIRTRIQAFLERIENEQLMKSR